MRPSNSKPAAQPVAEEAVKPSPVSIKQSSPAAAAPATPTATPTAKSAAKPPEAQARPPVKASVTTEKNGGATIKLEYAGGLAQYGEIWVRMGERRAGQDWLNTRDVKLEKVGALATTKVMLTPGEPIEGANFAFHAKKGEEELWDNAGRSFGCYVLDAKTGTISAR
jgi:hypothetical protein